MKGPEMTSSEENEQHEEREEQTGGGGTWTVISTDNGDTPESEK
jgi:hypothetical protein